MMSTTKICVIGLGYIGLPTAVMFASRGYIVNGFDIDSNVVNLINNGTPHINEPGLVLELNKVINSGNLKAFNQPIESDIYIVAVPTPLGHDFKANLSCVDKAIETITPLIKSGDLIVIESTCPLGTTLRIRNALITNRPDLNFIKENNKNKEVDINIAYCPERVLPGRIIEELTTNDRIVGGITNECSIKAKKLYKKFVDGEIHITDSRTAELAKLTENSFRDLNIAFANEISMICDDLQINTNELIRLSNMHPRVNILEPGVGVGGHCIAIDPWFIVESDPARTKLIKQAREVNNNKTQWVYEKIKTQINHTKHKVLKIGIMGLSFKPNVGDLRESPAMNIALKLATNTEATIIINEPNIDTIPTEFTGLNTYLDNREDAFEHADLIVVLVSHQEFFTTIKKYKNKKILDFCGLLK